MLRWSRSALLSFLRMHAPQHLLVGAQAASEALVLIDELLVLVQQSLGLALRVGVDDLLKLRHLGVELRAGR
jgi:hypothetical protein